MNKLIAIFLLAFGLLPCISQLIPGGQFGYWWVFPIAAVIIYVVLKVFSK